MRNKEGKEMACVCCPNCNHIYKTPDAHVDYCPICGWDGRWKQEKEEETKEIDHPALRGVH